MAEKPIVYFTKNITSESMVKIYDALNKDLKGKVAVKLHSGEPGNQNFLKPDFFEDIVKHVNGIVVECNTAYDGKRNESKKHRETLIKHGWEEMFTVDLMDEEGPDMVLDIPDGKILKKNYVGKTLKNYDSMLVLSHFKGHPMGGFGGALKQLSIGVASTVGKTYIHSAANETDQYKLWDNLPPQDDFLVSMGDSAASVVRHFNGNMAFINVMKNMSVDCDCCAVAEDPCMKDIGILASLDPVAIDQACVDLVYNSKDPGKAKLIERIESRNGLLTIKAAADLKIGSREYTLVSLDD